MILRELDRFLGVVDRAFDAHPDDLVAAIRARRRAACSSCAQDNPLLHAVVSATHGADTELLPLLTTHADVAARDRQGGGRRAGRRRTTSPLDGRAASTRPSTWSCGWCSATSCSPPARPSSTADDIAWIAARGAARPVSPTAESAGVREQVRLGSTTGRAVIAAAVLGSGMTLLDGTVVNVALRTIGEDLDASLAQLQWITNGYLLTLASADPARRLARRPVRPAPGLRGRHRLVRARLAAVRDRAQRRRC